MKLSYTAFATLCLIITGCTSTNQTLAPTASPSLVYLAADEIQSEILDKTIKGDSVFPSVGRVPFKMFFGSDPAIYKEESIINGKPDRVSGTSRVTADGSICRRSPARRHGQETCWRIVVIDGGYRMEEIGGRHYKFDVTTESGLQF